MASYYEQDLGDMTLHSQDMFSYYLKVFERYLNNYVRSPLKPIFFLATKVC